MKLQIVEMPLNADGRGPEMDPAKVARTVYEVWGEDLATVGELDAGEARVYGTARPLLEAAEAFHADMIRGLKHDCANFDHLPGGCPLKAAIARAKGIA